MNPPAKLRPGDVAALQNLLRERGIFKRYGLERIGVYGSFARGEAYNDIDLLIEPEPESWEHWRNLRDELEELFSTRVEVVILKYMDPIIHHRAKKDMRYVTGY
jgi:hypothetical protein